MDVLHFRMTYLVEVLVHGRSSLSGGADGWKERCIYVYKSMGYLVKENHVKVLVPITDW